MAFGPVAADTVTVVSATELTAVAPPAAGGNAGAVDVTVTTPGGTSATTAADQFTYLPVPAVTSVAPDAGPVAGGTTVTVTGSGLAQVDAVGFGTGTVSSFTVASDSSLTFSTPPHASGLVPITVTSPGGTSVVGAGDSFKAEPVPVVTSITPDAGPTKGKTRVTLTGKGLGNVTAVYFGSVRAGGFQRVSRTELLINAPPGAGSVPVTVTGPGGVSAVGATDWFDHVAPAVVTSVSPNRSAPGGGTTVVVQGENFIGVQAVDFATVPGTDVRVESPTLLTVDAPPHPAGHVMLSVVALGGSSKGSSAAAFLYRQPPVGSGVPNVRRGHSGDPSALLRGARARSRPA